MRDLLSTREMMEARSVNVEPITFPEPAIVSRRGVTVVVEAWARLAFGVRSVSVLVLRVKVGARV